MLLQTSAGVRDEDNTGVGFTVMVKVCTVPLQLCPPFVYVGVTVTVAVTGAVPVFAAVKAGMSGPEPLAASPIEVVLLVQE